MDVNSPPRSRASLALDGWLGFQMWFFSLKSFRKLLVAAKVSVQCWSLFWCIAGQDCCFLALEACMVPPGTMETREKVSGQFQLRGFWAMCLMRMVSSAVGTHLYLWGTTKGNSNSLQCFSNGLNCPKPPTIPFNILSPASPCNCSANVWVVSDGPFSTSLVGSPWFHKCFPTSSQGNKVSSQCMGVTKNRVRFQCPLKGNSLCKPTLWVT